MEAVYQVLQRKERAGETAQYEHRGRPRRPFYGEKEEHECANREKETEGRQATFEAEEEMRAVEVAGDTL